MNKNGPVIIIEDDEDDQYLLEQVFLKLNYQNKVVFFSDGQDALDYLQTTHELPFLILSDINMPRLDGFQLRGKSGVSRMLSSLRTLVINLLEGMNVKNMAAQLDSFADKFPTLIQFLTQQMVL